MQKKTKLMLFAAISLLLLAGFLYWQRDVLFRQFFSPTQTSLNQGISKTEIDPIVIAQNLDIPWGVAFLPDDTLLVTERTGVLNRISDGTTYQISGVSHSGEGGLLGLAPHPDFEQNNYLYLYLTSESGDGLINRVERYTYDGDSLHSKKVIINNIPGASFHDGGRIAFGPDDLLYITTGDAGNEQSAQDINSLAGKILRLRPDGSIPDDNPFNNAVYSYGHRNPQGLAWDSQGRLWSSEHGPSGLESGLDELNLIEPGKNYGWPVIRGDQTQGGMVNPVVHSGTEETWAPASLTYANGSLFFGGLRGESLYQAEIMNDAQVELTAHLRTDFGRIRTVTAHQDSLYLTTSNTDGRGEPRDGDDKLVRVGLEAFE